jgi:two-component system cell cycle sensor histidine kinase/response regulator CckA
MAEDRFDTLCRELLDTISSGVAVYDVKNDGCSGADYIIVDFNRAALSLEGKRRDEVVGKSLRDLRPNIDDFGLLPVFREVWRTGEPGFYPAKVYIDEQFANWYENRVFRLSADRIVSVYDDVTERKRVDESLRASEALLRDVLDSLEDKAIAIYEAVDDGADFVFLGMNKPAEAITHYRVEQVLGKRLRELFPAEQSIGLIATLNAVRQSGEVARIPLKQYKDDRITQWVENTIYPLPSGKVVAVFEDTFEQRMAERAREEERARYRLTQRIGKIGSWEYNLQTSEFWGSDEAKLLYGLDPASETFTTEDVESCIPERERVHQALLDLIAEEKPYDLEFEIVPHGGLPRRTITSIARLLRDERGEPLKVLGVVQDVTDKRGQEQQLRELERRYEQSQKLETVGRLAGGIAHDFNNLLTIINGHADFAIDELKAGHPLRDDLEQILQAGERAAALTRQLLAFSRKQLLEPKVLDLNEVIRGLQRMLHRILGEDIEIRIDLADDPGRIRADPGQIEQVLMNLAVNARDAMLQGGELRIETRAVVLEPVAATGSAPDPLGPEGPHVEVIVADNGVGMSPEVRARLFEPFFTTKEKGQGTGLGLATVYGIVKQSDGEISVESEPGKGTRFRLCFPQVEGEGGLARAAVARQEATGSETILLVEDEPAVRELARRILEGAGYVVLTAVGGEDALELSERYEQPIDLMVTDVVMPKMSGRELADRLGGARRGIKTLFVSGYTDDAIAHHGVLEAGINLLAKPFSSSALLAKVRRVLDGD